jgi:hypothetical protein
MADAQSFPDYFPDILHETKRKFPETRWFRLSLLSTIKIKTIPVKSILRYANNVFYLEQKGVSYYSL